MADQIANNAKGAFAGWLQRVEDNDPANSGLVIIALKLAQADDDLRGYVTAATLLANAGNTEADFTNYARIVYTDAALLTRTVDNVNDRVDVDMPDFTYSNAGGATNNNLVKLCVFYDPDTTAGTDADLLLISHHDFVQATNGSDVTAQVAAAGFGRAA